MNWNDLTWEWCDPPIDDARVDEVESVLGVRFPADFRECAKHCHGGAPTRRTFKFQDANGEMGSCLAVLLSFTPDKAENILDTHEMLADQLPAGLIPFAEDGGGDYMCFDYNGAAGSHSPGVVYWHRAGLPGNEVSTLSASFSNFLDMLR
jgi:cell wall assembly regulator SMI1